MQALKTERLSKVYHSGAGVKKVGLELEEGEVFGLLGPNGSGKSTFLRVVSTLSEASSGSFEVLGMEPREMQEEIKRKTAYLPENSAHAEHLTARENILLFAWAYGIEEDAAEGRARELFSLLGLNSHAEEKVKTFSYGMRRKLALCQVLLPEPRLLLLDEPTLGLDLSSKLSLYSHLRGLAARGNSVLIATNDTGEAQELCHRVGFLHKGELVSVGKPGKLLSEVEKEVKVRVKLNSPLKARVACPGVSILGSQNGTLSFVASSTALLPNIIQEILSSGGSIESISVREPDLGDVFLKKTGGDLK